MNRGHAFNHSTGACDICGIERNSAEENSLCVDHNNLPFVTKHLREMAKLFAERNAVYKDNFRMVGKLMEAMFPEGIELKTKEDHNKFHLFMLAIVKLSRYAINYQDGHKDSIDDMIVYMSMVAALDAEAANANKR